MQLVMIHERSKQCSLSAVMYGLCLGSVFAGSCNSGVGNYFTRRAKFGKTVEAAGRALIGKQGEDLFFWRSRFTHECDLQNKRFSPRFLFQFCTVELIF